MRPQSFAMSDDLCREVYCVLGMPIDAVEMPAVLDTIYTAAANAKPCLISTPNLNFLVNSWSDPEFRQSLLLSDLCPADGMPIVWIARLLGIPIRRVAGSDIFDALKSLPPRAGRQPVKVFLFGATEVIAAQACERLNRNAVGVKCVGWLCPGFGDLDELSEAHFLDQINKSDADFLVVALGAKKGQSWLRQNHDRLQIPIRCHLGATVNFQAGAVRRAPYTLQKLSLEWLWRIKEEPGLFWRYWNDGLMLLRLLFGRALPLACRERWWRLIAHRSKIDFAIAETESDHSVRLRLRGCARADQVPETILSFRKAAASQKQISIDLSQVRTVDARFLGLLLMFVKQMSTFRRAPQFVGASRKMQRLFKLNGVQYLLLADDRLTEEPKIARPDGRASSGQPVPRSDSHPSRP